MHIGTVLIAALGTAVALMFVAWLLCRATDKASWVDADRAYQPEVSAFIPWFPTTR